MFTNLGSARLQRSSPYRCHASLPPTAHGQPFMRCSRRTKVKASKSKYMLCSSFRALAATMRGFLDASDPRYSNCLCLILSFLFLSFNVSLCQFSLYFPTLFFVSRSLFCVVARVWLVVPSDVPEAKGGASKPAYAPAIRSYGSSPTPWTWQSMMTRLLKLQTPVGLCIYQAVPQGWCG